jgi:putative drug exporter of the RND superfamily
MLKGLARICYRRRGSVLVLWVVLVASLVIVGNVVGDEFRNEFEAPPGSGSAAALEILEANGFEERAGEQGTIVFRAEGGVDQASVRTAMTSLFAAIEENVEGVVVVSPYTDEGSHQVSRDRSIAFAELHFSQRSSFQEYEELGQAIMLLAEPIDTETLTIEFGGDMFADWSDFQNQIFGLIGAVIILVIAFGSFLAMLLPVVAALFGIGSAAGLIQGATSVITMPDFTMAAAAMIAIGVGIDYALLIVTRFRAALREGSNPEEAVVFAVHTAGRAVVFAGLTFVISILGLFFMGIDAIRGMAIACAIGVMMTMFASITLVPALLGFAGHRIDRFGLPWRGRGAEAAPGSVWHRWSRVIQRHPWPAAVAGLAVVLVLTSPVFAMRLGFADAGNRAETDTTRRAYDMLAEGFGPGFNGPLILAATLPPGGDASVLDGLTAELRETPGVAFVSQPISNDTGGAALFQVIPETSPQSSETSSLVHRLRNDVIPGAIESTGAEVQIGGMTALSDDFSSYTASRLPIFIAAVLILSFVLLMAVFRSVVVAIKAVIMNLLSIGAAYGIVVAMFQWGIGASLFGIHETGPVEAWAPMMMFAILFGLSMDYEVFLLSRIREEYDKSCDTTAAVADGLAATGRVITAAAAIMIVVFASFALGDERALTLLGVGLAAAILVDASLVRMVLVPAFMEILGDKNWWLPSWLDRVLPTVRIEGHRGERQAERGRAAEPTSS